MKEILYSIRHAHDWDSGSEEVGNSAEERSQEELEASIKDLFNKVENESRFIPVPERLKIADKLISRTIALAKKLALNVDIVRNDDSIDFYFFDSISLFQGDLKDFLGEMFIICDIVSMYK